LTYIYIYVHLPPFQITKIIRRLQEDFLDTMAQAGCDNYIQGFEKMISPWPDKVLEFCTFEKGQPPTLRRHRGPVVAGSETEDDQASVTLASS
jgi:hypothetical protein